MALRVQFISSVVGTYTEDTADPVGINALSQEISRSKENDGVIFEIILDLDFLKGSRRFLMQAFLNGGGVDAKVTVNIYDYDPNIRRWELYYIGTVNFMKRDLDEEKVTVTLEQTGVQRNVVNSLGLDVDIETESSRNGSALPAQYVIPDLLLHSKKILKESLSMTGIKNDEGGIDYPMFQQLDVFDQDNIPGLQTTYRERIIYGNLSTDRKGVDELPEQFDLPFGWADFVSGVGITGPATAAQTRTWLLANKDIRFPMFTAEEDGVLDVDLVLKLKHEFEASNPSGDIDVCGDGALGNCEVYAWFELRNSADDIISLVNIGTWSMPGCGDNLRTGVFETKTYQNLGIDIGIGWKVYVYETVRIYADYENNDIGDDHVNHHFRIWAEDGYYISLKSATTAPPTTTKAVMIYEVVERCCQFVTNQIDCFRSTLCGRPDIIPAGLTESPYTVDGDAALIAWTNGNLIRGRDKQIITNLTEVIEFLNMAFCASFGFETVNGKQYLRLERREYFYKKNTKILSLGQVAKPIAKIDTKRYFNQIELGYVGKIDIGQVNGIDEFNTTRRFEIPIESAKGGLKVSVKTRASGYEIEYQRRLASSTADGKKDDENFVVCVVRDGDTFKSRSSEGFDSITNVYDPDSGYNYPIAPARCLQNWLSTLAGALVLSFNKTLKFTFGEVNYIMTSQKTGELAPIAENGTFDVSGIEPIWENEKYFLKDVPFSRDQMKLVKAEPYGYIEFQDRFGETFEGYIDNMSHSPNDNKADFELLKVFRP